MKPILTRRWLELTPRRDPLICCGLALLLAFCGCRDAANIGSTPHQPRSLDTIAQDYVRLALALGERDPDSLDFAVVPESLHAEMHTSYPPLDTIANQANALRDELARTPPADAEAQDRKQFLTLQLSAIATRTAMLRGRTLPFDAEAQALFATSRLADRWADQRQSIRAQVLALLPPAGAARTSPAERYAAYDRLFLVPPQRLAAVMNAALTACRQQTLRSLPLPAEESVELTFVSNQPWSAFSRYRGHGHSTISINLDFPLTVDAALELACHEGYPGHHVFNTLRDQALVAHDHRPEAAVQLTFSPQSYVSEAAAAYAPRLAFSLAERTAIEQIVLFPLAGLPSSEAARYVRLSSLVRQLASSEPAIVRDYLDGTLEIRARWRATRQRRPHGSRRAAAPLRQRIPKLHARLHRRPRTHRRAARRASQRGHLRPGSGAHRRPAPASLGPVPPAHPADGLSAPLAPAASFSPGC